MEPETTISAAAAEAAAAAPPPSNPTDHETSQDGARLSQGELASCGCEALDPALLQSAWEQAAIFKEGSADDDGTGGTNSSNRSSSSFIRVSPTENLDLRIFCGTWNVAGRILDDYNEIAEWLDADLGDEEGDEACAPDMFVVGFQEVVELSPQNVVMDSFLDTQSRANSLKWFTKIYGFLARYGQRHGVRYVIVGEQRLLGTYMLIMASAPLSRKISHVQSEFIPTGLGGLLGNKGAVAIRMEVAGLTSLCFVCVHMTAHRENVEARNADYRVIMSRPIFAETNGRLDLKRKDDNDKQQAGGGWASLFGGTGQPNSQAQSQSQGGMSPTRNAELKKAIRTAMAFGLPRAASGSKAGATGTSSTSSAGVTQGDVGGVSGREGSLRPLGKGHDVAVSFKEPLKEGTAVEGGGELMFLTGEDAVHHHVNGLPKTKTVLEADIVFWIGDLNYRIVEEVSDADVFEMVNKDDLETLRTLDQLNVERTAGRAFREFQEGPLCFPPTYKYIPGTKELDNRPEKKSRCPSWTDRVLYSVGMYGGDSVRRLALDRYWSSGPLLSDHMPVSALFRTSFTCAPEEKLAEPEIEVEPLSPRRAAAKAAFTSAPFPRIEVDPPALALTLPSSEASEKPTTVATVRVTNSGGLQGAYHVCTDNRPAWLRVEGAMGALAPGDKSELTLLVDLVEARAAAAQGSAGGLELPAEYRDSVCAVLRVEVDEGGAGMLLPVVCRFAKSG